MRSSNTRREKPMDKETLQFYKEMVSIAGEGVDEYLAVVAELRDASVLSGKISAETAENAEEWAHGMTRYVTEDMESENVVPHYYLAALIAMLYDRGFSSLVEGLAGAVETKFREDNA